MSKKNKPNEIYITRLYDAPLSLVWKAWTDPKITALWWGPRGFTLTHHSKDLRVGGQWHYTMHGPDGVDYPNKTTYHEVIPEARLVYDHGANDTQGPLFRVSVNFTEVKGKTKMEMTMSFPTEEIALESRKFIKKAGGNATWDRLGEYLEDNQHKKDIFIINRSFNTSQETLFKMWCDPHHLSQWIPPTGFTMNFIRANIKTGGETFYSMTNGSTVTLYARAKYLEVSPHHRLQYTQQFCDENENSSKHPLAPIWPETMLTTVTFEDEGDHHTRVSVRWETHGNTSEAEASAFNQAKSGMTMGWTGSFDKLEEHLNKL